MSDKLDDRIVTNSLPQYSTEAPTSPANAQISTIKRSAATIDAIKTYLLERHLKAGDPLPTEARMCDILGVSRSSVREALRTLEALDIVSAKQGLGWFVGGMSLQPMVDTLLLRFALDQQSGSESLRQVVALRRYLDLGVASQVVASLKGTQDEQLDNVVQAMIERSQAGDWYTEQDIAFHRLILTGLNNPLLDQLISAMWLIHQAFLSTQDHPADSMEQTAYAHLRMLEAARAGDVDAYILAVYEHYGPLVDLLNDHETPTEEDKH